MKARLSLLLVLGAASAAALPDSESVESSAYAVATEPAAPPTPAPAQRLPTVPDEIERQLALLDRDEHAAKKQLESLARESEQLKVRTVARGRAYVRMARAGLLPVGGGFESLVDHASKLERLHRALERDLSAEKELFRRRIALGKQIDALRVRRGPLEVQQQAMSEARGALLAAQDRRLAFDRAFEPSGSDSHTAIYGAGATPAVESAGSIAAMKGRLPFPLPGRTEVKTSSRADGLGLEMRAPRGTPVKAIFPGRIAFADEYADYGRTVIVDHGEQHYSVSANLEDISVRVGDDVSAGMRLGSVGEGPRGALLYFEIRVGSENIDASGWFGI